MRETDNPSNYYATVLGPDPTIDLMHGKAPKLRPEMTRRRRLGLAAWHARMTFSHLWAIVRGH